MVNKFKSYVNKRRYVLEFLVSTVIPVLITLFEVGIPDKYINGTIRAVITAILAVADLAVIICMHWKDIKYKGISLIVKTKGTAYTNAYQLSERKRNEIAKRTYRKNDEPDLTVPEKYIPYNVHDYIAEICINFRDTIAQITSINQEHMPVTFIYHYDYHDATPDDRSWKWVVGKEASTRTKLDKFIERDCSLYNYLVNGKEGKVNSVFNNSKKDLAYEGHYYMSPRDEDHNKIGSVFAIKVLFGNNAENFVEGILLVSSYGKQFVEKDSEYTENGLKNLIFEELYPYYQRLLETELGVLYLRHEKNKTESKKTCDSDYCCKKEHCEKGEERK